MIDYIGFTIAYILAIFLFIFIFIFGVYPIIKVIIKATIEYFIERTCVYDVEVKKLNGFKIDTQKIWNIHHEN